MTKESHFQVLALALGAKPDTTTKKAPLKSVQAQRSSDKQPISKEGKAPTTPSSPKKNHGRPSKAPVKPQQPALDLSSTTPFDYPDIVGNITLPEGMFEVEDGVEDDDSDEIELPSIQVMPPMSPPAKKSEKVKTTKAKKVKSTKSASSRSTKSQSKGTKNPKSGSTTKKQQQQKRKTTTQAVKP